MKRTLFFLIASLLLSSQTVWSHPLFTHAATHPTKDGFYIVGVWTYKYFITGLGTRMEGRRGTLLYKGHEITAPSGTIVATPVGKFMYFPLPEAGVHKIWGADGWLQTDCYDAPIFHDDGSPASDNSNQVNGISGEKAKTIDVADLLKINNQR